MRRKRVCISFLVTLSSMFLVAFSFSGEYQGEQSSNIQFENGILTEVSTSASEQVKYSTISTLIEKVTEKQEQEEKETKTKKRYVTKPYVVECTAYNPTGNPCKDGTYPVEGETLAGKYSWLGRHCNLYYCTDDGKIGKKIGTYTFHDTGFGHDPDGDGIGSIQTGQRIDLFMESTQEAKCWGVRNVYIEFLD